jgi:anti-anti-sigma factor
MSAPVGGLRLRLARFEADNPGLRLSSGVSRKPPSLVIHVAGVLDTNNSPGFLGMVLGCLDEARAHGGLIIDLEGLSYASSTGVGALTSILIEAQRNRLAFRLCHIPHNVGAVLDVLGFSTFFDRIDSFEAEA